VIPRIRIGSQQKPSRVAGRQDSRPIFGSRHPLRPLRVLLDAELLADEQPWSRLGLLRGLLTHELVELYRYAEDGPPADEPRLSAPMRGEWVRGWAVLGDFHEAHNAYDLYWVERPDGLTAGAVWGNAYDVAANDADAQAYEAESTDDAARLRKRDAIAAEVADTLKADVFITRREYLHVVDWSLAAGVTFLTPEDALPFLSLYVRAQGEFYIWKDEVGASTVNRGLFYWVGTMELLPAAWRWSAACAQLGSATKSARLVHTGNAAWQRFDRALELRDLVHRALDQPQDNDVADDALMAFDSALVFLMGALDAVARVAHDLLRLAADEKHNAGWQRDRWLRKVRSVAPELAALVSTGSTGHSALQVLKTLRNTVHSAGLLPVGVATARLERQRTLIDLSAGIDDETLRQVLAAMDLLGGRQAWGVEHFGSTRHLADPGMLLDHLLPAVAQLLDDLMGTMPFETFGGVQLTEQDRQPPRVEAHRAFGARGRESIRWQLGL
jgi:hypothetical protein